ncbi:MAG TPA: UDP-N-acetylmuramoyl-tripeptide--D-alanyl-D-alanine ligase [Candidatus Methylacidiphilales bacterium]|jgi:UDP-N-acetylmuramoyl-tripeptide--D-alanyl-D-alanine ligase|nr:UDP-N-acetylmuramoyl-tripeptide--D-alanyl-D-alanine ligase [Candidatus Methylacidiphilales bacterium]
MRRCTLEEVARFSGGRLIRGDPSLSVDRLHTDTRTLLAGDCFVALQGDRFDGHAFVPQVKGRGAVAALVSHGLDPADLPGDLGLVEVPDTLEALQRFAANYRQLLSVRTIGVTGSSGKTSTKELIASVLRVRFKTKATEGNLNNHIGVPLTLIRLDEDDEYGVVEMGMNHPGELAPLVKMTAPEIGVISSIGPAHIEFFSDQAAIAAEKAELIAALPPEGLAVLNADDEWSRRVANRTHARVVWVGDHPDSSWRAQDLQIAADGLSFLLRHNGSAATVRLPVMNRVMAANALLAAAVGRECGLTMDEIARGLEAVRLPGARMQVLNAHGSQAASGPWIINDSYNANPDSMKAALTALGEFPGAIRRLAVLGSMGELGRHAAELHREVGEFAARRGLEFLIAVGPHAEACAKGAMEAGLSRNRIVAALDAEEAAVALKPLLREGDAVLVKGSHFMGLERLVNVITGKDAS